MSGTSYPSPPTSNVSSPHLEPELSSLRQLDIAFQRVRQLRRDIIQNYLSQPRSQDSSGIGPPHEAILLSGGPNERSSTEQAIWERLRIGLPADTMERLRQFEAQRASGEEDRSLRSLRMTTNHLSPLNIGSNGSSQPSSSQSSYPLPSVITRSSHTPLSPISPPRQPFLPRRHLEVRPPHSQGTFDDSQTTLGRRVAEVESQSTGNLNSSRRSLDTGMPDLVFRVTRQRRSEPTPSNRNSNTSSHQPDIEAHAPILVNVDSPSSQSLGAPVRTPANRRTRNMRGSGDSRQNSGSGGRLSVLSNFSVQNLPTPSSALHHGPSLLFDEPASYDDSHRERMESIDEEMSSSQDRSYVVNRQMTLTGEEYVHEVNVDWEALGIPGRVADSPVQFSTDYSLRTTFGSRVFPLRVPGDHQPSGAIRLNADGDPISHNEQQTHYPGRIWPRWRENNADARSNRSIAHQIVILPDGSEETWPLDSSPSPKESPRVIGSDAPFCPDPLPMPVEQMIEYKSCSRSAVLSTR
ncbi:hypothetical protein Moror_13183 [Moniliophthora roreri MCA 2997]|uniref:Uncharacterized protein n=2 Tax=Moniliophthora roreri TaxID=221103 RepID=V2X838_MONRO|nr:hypothetical protein Moror_13183 [Moniliophthora roreri MCA 2997]KAI3615612.1 hypothetical protein WG66_011714 [Moniliophthora roreri]